MTELSTSAKTGTATGTATTVSDVESEDPKKHAKEKEIPLVHDQGFFQHNTGDMYDGFFEAKKKDRSVKMQGPGVYTTAEGDCYKGNWEADKFGANSEVVISFIDGSKYEGLIKDWCYHNRGIYTYPDGSILKGDFVENCPVGNLNLADPNGHTWLGKAEHGFGWFQPVNHFYEFLDTPDQNRLRRRQKATRDAVSLVSK